MDMDAGQYWGGTVLIVLAGLLLFAPLVLDWRYTNLLLAVAVLGLAAGTILIGWSRRGRTA